VYIRLRRCRPGQFTNRAEFFAAAVRNMRQYLMDYARHHNAKKRRGQKIPLDAVDIAGPEGPDWVVLDAALRRLECANADWARVVEFRCFGGMTFEKIGE